MKKKLEKRQKHKKDIKDKVLIFHGWVMGDYWWCGSKSVQGNAGEKYILQFVVNAFLNLRQIYFEM